MQMLFSSSVSHAWQCAPSQKSILQFDILDIYIYVVKKPCTCILAILTSNLSSHICQNSPCVVAHLVTYITSSAYDIITGTSPQIARDVSRCQPLWAIYTTMHNSVCGIFLDGLVSCLIV